MIMIEMINVNECVCVCKCVHLNMSQYLVFFSTTFAYRILYLSPWLDRAPWKRLKMQKQANLSMALSGRGLKVSFLSDRKSAEWMIAWSYGSFFIRQLVCIILIHISYFIKMLKTKTFYVIGLYTIIVNYFSKELFINSLYRKRKVE